MSEDDSLPSADPSVALLKTAVWTPLPGSRLGNVLAPMRMRQTQLTPPSVTHRGTIAVAGFPFGLTCWRLSNGDEHIDPRAWKAYLATLGAGGTQAYTRAQIADAVRRLLGGEGHE